MAEDSTLRARQSARASPSSLSTRVSPGGPHESASSSSTKPRPVPLRRRQGVLRRFSGFAKRHTIGTAIATVVISVALGIWMVLSTPAPGDLTKQRMSPPVHAINDPNFLKAVKDLHPSFTVAANPTFAAMTTGEAASWLGDVLWSVSMEHAPVCPPAFLEIPAAYDARQDHPECYSSARIPSPGCAASWATASADAIGARLCHQDAGPRLSAQAMLSCAKALGSCEGGAVDIPMVIAMQEGLVPDSCMPYEGRQMDCPEALCPEEPRRRIEGFCRVTDSQHLKSELAARGPVSAVMLMTDDLLLYTGGVYRPTPLSRRLLKDGLPVTHAVVVEGWGYEADEEYWLVSMDLGPHFGEIGRLKLAVDSGMLPEMGVVAPIVHWADIGDIDVEGDFAGEGDGGGEADEEQERFSAESGDDGTSFFESQVV